ncbi:Hypothetical_protein [Hexamita inflata]|uniref:Hypothetical_protein n=1 Tax=Hexamita inflata TaxID=28002 RepID=A0AA86RKP9_9EUKA|nr:Hypothetical protein HINF_LOCUS63038 [Hexamita inflata]
MDNTALQYIINWVFNNVRDIPIPEICELGKKPYKEGHEQDCKKINELNIAANDRFANFLERILRKRYQARKVCKDNDNRLEDRTKPDISIVVNGVQIYQICSVMLLEELELIYYKIVIHIQQQVKFCLKFLISAFMFSLQEVYFWLYF